MQLSDQIEYALFLFLGCEGECGYLYGLHPEKLRNEHIIIKRARRTPLKLKILQLFYDSMLIFVNA